MRFEYLTTFVPVFYRKKKKAIFNEKNKPSS